MMHTLFFRFVLWAFDRFYHEGAWTYDTVAWLVSRGYWERWAIAVLPEYQHVPLLDLGCGTGFVQRDRVSAFPLTVGLDESWPMLKLSRRKIRQRSGSPHLVRAVGQALPFASDSWPLVFASFPAPYLFAPETLQDIKRVLHSTGTLVIVDGGMLPQGWYAHAVALLYQIVLGRTASEEAASVAEDPRIQRLTQFGFMVNSRWIQVGRSRIQILEATHANP